MQYDYLIIGGGIVGVSTAWQLKQREPNASVLLLEKECDYSQHQTGHNSGVIHAGIYYAPGSLKAEFCKKGVEATIQFCQQHDIAYEQCGKLLVATNSLEYQRMQVLFERAQQNGLDVEWLDAQQLKAREPNILGVAGLLVNTTGIVNYQQVTRKMAEQFIALGGEARLQHEVIGLTETPTHIEAQVKTATGLIPLQSRFMISCSGLMADRTTKMLGIKTDFQIIPFRGEYYRLPKKHNDIVKHLIYPVPDPELPFLGVHLTRMIDGSVTVGPNAVQGWKREGYGRINLSAHDIWDMVRFKGFWQVLRQHWKTGLVETKNSWYKPGYLKQVQKYCPQLCLEDLEPYPAGVRAQAVLQDGSLVHDFLFASSARSLHVCNAPSPAATSAIPIGEYLCDKVLQQTQKL